MNTEPNRPKAGLPHPMSEISREEIEGLIGELTAIVNYADSVIGDDRAAIRKAISVLSSITGRMEDRPDGRGWQMPAPEWRNDEFGNERGALYVGKIYAGCIMQWGAKYPASKDKPWRGWIMNNPDGGQEIGWFTTADEARTSVDAALRAALYPAEGGPPTPPSSDRTARGDGES